MSQSSRISTRLTSRHWLFVVGFITLLSTNANATLLNSDFSTGFSGWFGDYTYYDISEDNDIDILGTTTFPTELYQLNGGGSVTLMTALYPTGDDEAWFVSLFQSFDVDTLLAPGNQLLLSLAVVGAGDILGAQLVSDDLSKTLNLNGGGTFDITDWAGISATITFYVEDFDTFLGDSLTISNLAITQVTRDVPEPSMFALLALAGILALRRKLN